MSAVEELITGGSPFGTLPLKNRPEFLHLAIHVYHGRRGKGNPETIVRDSWSIDGEDGVVIGREQVA